MYLKEYNVELCIADTSNFIYFNRVAQINYMNTYIIWLLSVF